MINLFFFIKFIPSTSIFNSIKAPRVSFMVSLCKDLYVLGLNIFNKYNLSFLYFFSRPPKSGYIQLNSAVPPALLGAGVIS